MVGARWQGHSLQPWPNVDTGGYVAVLDRRLCMHAPGIIAGAEAFVWPAAAKTALGSWQLQAWRCTSATGRSSVWHVAAQTPMLEAPSLADLVGAAAVPAAGADSSVGGGGLWANVLPKPLAVEAGDCLGWYHAKSQGFLAYDGEGGDVAWARLSKLTTGDLVDFATSPGHTMTGTAPRTYSIRACWAPTLADLQPSTSAELPCPRALAPATSTLPQWQAPATLDCTGNGFAETWQNFREALMTAAAAAAAATTEGRHRPWEKEDYLADVAEDHLLAVPIDDQHFILKGVASFEDGLVGVDSHLTGFCLYGIVAALVVRARHLLRNIAHEGLACEMLHFSAVLLGLSKSARDFLESSKWPIHSGEILELLHRRGMPGRWGDGEDKSRGLWPSPEFHFGGLLPMRGSISVAPTGGCIRPCAKGAQVLGHAVVLRPLVDSAQDLSFVDTSLCAVGVGTLRHLRIYLRVRGEQRPQPGVEGLRLQVWRPEPEESHGIPAYVLAAESGALMAGHVGLHELDLDESGNAIPLQSGDCIGWRYSEAARGAISYAEADDAPLVRWHRGSVLLGAVHIFPEAARRVYSLSLAFSALDGCLEETPSRNITAQSWGAPLGAAVSVAAVLGLTVGFRIAALGDHVTGDTYGDCMNIAIAYSCDWQHAWAMLAVFIWSFVLQIAAAAMMTGWKGTFFTIVGKIPEAGMYMDAEAVKFAATANMWKLLTENIPQAALAIWLANDLKPLWFVYLNVSVSLILAVKSFSMGVRRIAQEDYEPL